MDSTPRQTMTMLRSQKPRKQVGEDGVRGVVRGGPEDVDHGGDGLAADPALDAEPAAGHEGSEECGDVRPAGAEAGADEDREGDAVASRRRGR